jgi:hypothetical protein
MRVRRWRRWLCALVFGVLGLLAFAPVAARAENPSEPPRKDERVVKIGPQAVVIVNERGDARMYDDPSQQVATCKSTLSCLGKTLGVFGVTAYLWYEDADIGPDFSNRHLLVGAP